MKKLISATIIQIKIKSIRGFLFHTQLRVKQTFFGCLAIVTPIYHLCLHGKMRSNVSVLRDRAGDDVPPLHLLSKSSRSGKFDSLIGILDSYSAKQNR